MMILDPPRAGELVVRAQTGSVREVPMPDPAPKTASDVRSMEPIRDGAYLCLGAAHRTRRIATEVRALAEQLELQGELQPGGDHPQPAIAFLGRIDAAPPPRAIGLSDDALLATLAIVHVAAPAPGPVAAFCAELTRLTRLVAPAEPPRVLGGVVRPMVYTGAAIFNFAYAHRVLQQPARIAPHAFFVPMRKTSAWWQKDWMERHTYFQPRHEGGRMVGQGHALASAAGVASLVRRTYQHPHEPAPAGAYDFLTCFGCADAGVPVFHEVCAALRDEAKNSEWAFVREGPTWHGRRVAGWDERSGGSRLHTIVGHAQSRVQRRARRDARFAGLRREIQLSSADHAGHVGCRTRPPCDFRSVG